VKGKWPQELRIQKWRHRECIRAARREEEEEEEPELRIQKWRHTDREYNIIYYKGREEEEEEEPDNLEKGKKTRLCPIQVVCLKTV